jgi:hypothetical protein
MERLDGVERAFLSIAALSFLMLMASITALAMS